MDYKNKLLQNVELDMTRRDEKQRETEKALQRMKEKEEETERLRLEQEKLAQERSKIFFFFI